MNGKNSGGFYEIPEVRLHAMVVAHYNGWTQPASNFSSWAASLHLVLRYAEWMNESDNPHIAVIDTKKLDNEVLVWHVPHLVYRSGVLEYMAYGRITGRGYKAVPLKALKAKGLLNIFPEIATIPHTKRNHCCGWGSCVRRNMFAEVPKPLETDEFDQIVVLASLFEHLSLPVATALVCIRPRPWVRPRLRPWVHLVRACKATLWGYQTVSEVARQFDGVRIPPDLRKETWLRQGAVNTGGCIKDDFPDVRQWIDLLRAICEQDESITAQTIRKDLSLKVRKQGESRSSQSANT
jgi:hypothetical protein